ncbi:putative branched-chain amino acid transport protein (ATP binding protein); livG-like protein [uncultured delta proteobacterium]|uniref:Putative branched-chain amino acid transport protein (ATP binding protein) livG-like protein n=1 Tax=uncultured delta proteobacterium TaxID=34034 RepID=A0A212K4P3_9DELT|nr:putative branched-chain amino acid transport protein (ATP binding protein); livG-like protein [uncultured delta proteobacterium]
MSELRIESISKHFAGVSAVNNVSFTLEQGSIMGLIGPNGAGKSTVFRMVTGVHRADAGHIFFEGKEITGLPPYTICQRGIAMTSQTTLPFMKMSVLQSTMVGSYLHCPKAADAKKDAFAILEYLQLDGQWNKLVADCNIADRKKAELARALATRPRLLLLDELMAGLNPQEVDMILQKIREIRDDKGITILFVEHLMQAVMSISEKVVVLDHGELIAMGTPAEVSRNEQVITAYLGKNYHAEN